MSRLNASIVEQFFEREQENARQVMRVGMDSCMGKVFDQMKRKFVQLVANEDVTTETSNEHSDLSDRQHQQQHSNSTDITHFPSTSNQSKIMPIAVEEEIDANNVQFPTNKGATADNLNVQDDEIVVANELGKNVGENDYSNSRPTKRQRSLRPRPSQLENKQGQDGNYDANASKLKIHELNHRNVEFYRCKWQKCEFPGSASKSQVIDHIRRHLKKAAKQNPSTNNMSFDPNHYLKILWTS